MSNRFAIISISLLLLLNIVDATVTIVAIDAGYAKEANPIMNYFLEISYSCFLFVKFVGFFTGFLKKTDFLEDYRFFALPIF